MAHTAVLEAIEEGAVELCVKRAIRLERWWQLLGVSRHHHTLRASHLLDVQQIVKHIAWQVQALALWSSTQYLL